MYIMVFIHGAYTWINIMAVYLHPINGGGRSYNCYIINASNYLVYRKMLTNSIHRTKIVSFPRSGHHLLVRGLQAVFESELVYSEFYKSEHNMENCPYVNVQKSHDFNLDEMIDPEMKYVVLSRTKDDALKSWHKQGVVYGQSTLNFSQFEEQKEDYYEGFFQKWIIKHSGLAPIYFEDFIQNKLTTLLRVCNFISTKPLTPYQIISAKAWEKRESLGFWMVMTNYLGQVYRLSSCVHKFS